MDSRARTKKASAHAAVPGAAAQIDEVLTGAAAVTFAAPEQVTSNALGLLRRKRKHVITEEWHQFVCGCVGG